MATENLRNRIARAAVERHACPKCGVQRGMSCVGASRKSGPPSALAVPHDERLALGDDEDEPAPSGLDEQRALVLALAEYRCVKMCREDDKPCRECERLAENVVACWTDVLRNELAAALGAPRGER